MKEQHSIHSRVKDYAKVSFDKLFSELDFTDSGLSDDKADKSRELYGENVIVNQHKDTVLFRLRRSFINPFSIVLLFLAIISFFTDVLLESNFSKNITTISIILTMLIISGIIRFTQENRCRKISQKLVQLINTTVAVKRNGSMIECTSDKLVVGDIVRLEAGDRVPADIRVIKSSDFFVTQSVITGESVIIEKNNLPLDIVPKKIKDYTNTVFMGSDVIGGSCEGVVLAVGKDTVYGALSPNLISNKNSFVKGENSIAWVLIRFMACLIPIVFVACGITKGNWIEAFLFAISVAVGLTPELLPMVITACLTRGSVLMSKKRTIVKNINAMQSLGSMDVLCVDKTGTLTGDKVLLEYYMDVLGNESSHTLDIAYLNSYYHTGISNHLDKAILKAHSMPKKSEYYNKLVASNSKLDEVPFDYNLKLAGVLLKTDSGNLLAVKGEIKEVIRHCKYVEYNGKIHDMGDDALESVNAVVEEMLEDGMKVLAVATKKLDKDTLTPEDESELTLIGYLAFFDAPKQSAKEAIDTLKNLNIKVKVLTGDHSDVAISVCKRVGIDISSIMTGEELELLSDNDLPIAVDNCNIFAELSPKQKSRVVEILQDNGHSVGFLGDGMNDLPSIVQADVGISVDTATEAVKECADVILLKKDLNVIGDGVLEGRKSFANMSKYIRITASSNFGNICAIVIASVLLPFFPMTSLQILLLNLLYDVLCLILPWDNVDKDFYEKPLEWSGKSLAKFMLFFGPISSIFDIITFVFLYFFLCPHLCGASYSELNDASRQYFVSLFQTGWFLESMWSQVLILHLLRTNGIPFIHSKPSRPTVIVTLLGIIVFSILTVTSSAASLGLAAMPIEYFVFLILDVSLYLLIVTILKKIYIKKHQTLL